MDRRSGGETGSGAGQAPALPTSSAAGTAWARVRECGCRRARNGSPPLARNARRAGRRVRPLPPLPPWRPSRLAWAGAHAFRAHDRQADSDRSRNRHRAGPDSEIQTLAEKPHEGFWVARRPTGLQAQPEDLAIGPEEGGLEGTPTLRRGPPESRPTSADSASSVSSTQVTGSAKRRSTRQAGSGRRGEMRNVFLRRACGPAAPSAARRNRGGECGARPHRQVATVFSPARLSATPRFRGRCRGRPPAGRPRHAPRRHAARSSHCRSGRARGRACGRAGDRPRASRMPAVSSRSRRPSRRPASPSKKMRAAGDVEHQPMRQIERHQRRVASQKSASRSRSLRSAAASISTTCKSGTRARASASVSPRVRPKRAPARRGRGAASRSALPVFSTSASGRSSRFARAGKRGGSRSTARKRETQRQIAAVACLK